MSLETIVNDLVLATDALHDAITDKRTVLDNAAQQAAASLTTTQGLQAQAATSAAIAAAKATEATNNATQIAAYKTAAAALDTTTTASAAVAAQAADAMARFDPARHPFRNKLPSLVLDFGRQSAHKYSPLTGLVRQAITDVVTFTRNSTATYTGPDGLLKTAAINEPRYDYDPVTGECKGILIEEQRTNLLLRSSRFLGAGSWYPTGGCIATPSDVASYSGNMVGVKLTSTGLEFTRLETNSVPVVAGTKYSLTFVLRKGTSSHAHFTVEKWGVSTIRAVTDLTTLACTVSQDTFTTASASARSFGNFIAVTIIFTPSTSDARTIFVGPSNGGTNSVAGSTLYVFSAQLEAGAFPTSYIPSTDTFTSRASTATYLDSNGVLQTAAINTARSAAYDYDSDGVLRPIGLLLEPAATNLITYSQAIDHASWVKTAGGVATAPAVTANYGVAPDGTTTASRVVMALNGGTTISDDSSLNVAVTTVAGTTYTYSVWLKTVDGSTKTLQLSNQGETVSLLTVTGSWQRFQLTAKAADTTRGFRLCLRGTTGTSDSADVLVWGAQMGVGYYATSYIPTAGSQVTRAADVSTSAQSTRAADDAKITGAAFTSFYNQSGGTLGIRMSSVGTDNSHGFGVWAYGADNTSLVGISNNNVTDAAVLTTGFVTQARNQTVLTPLVRAAVSYRRDAFTAAFNGAVGTQDTSCLIPTAVTLRIGANGVGGQWGCGTISRITYYPQAFTNEELQAITTL